MCSSCSISVILVAALGAKADQITERRADAAVNALVRRVLERPPCHEDLDRSVLEKPSAAAPGAAMARLAPFELCGRRSQWTQASFASVYRSERALPREAPLRRPAQAAEQETQQIRSRSGYPGFVRHSGLEGTHRHDMIHLRRPKQPCCWSEANFSVSEQYDYSRSTEENYAAVSPADGASTGEFRDHRKALDYSYHSRYSAARQRIQDDIVREMLVTVSQDCKTQLFCSSPADPWVVFMAGAMGVGKTEVIRWLTKEAVLPLASFVQVDPDVIRYMLPEMKGYVERNRTIAGSQTQKEAGYIQEILTHEALEMGKNVLIHGTLHNEHCNRKLINRIREEHPLFKIAIVHVVAEPSSVLMRAAKRAEKTGREVPEDILLTRLREVPKTVEKLMPLADYFACVNNDGPEPVVASGDGSWSSFADYFTQHCDVDASFRSLNSIPGFLKPESRQLHSEDLESPTLEAAVGTSREGSVQPAKHQELPQQPQQRSK